MSEFFLNEKNASKTRLKEAENARKNRAEFVSAYSQGRISRRDLVKLGLITSAGLIVPKNGLSPFASSAYGATPTGTLASPLFGAAAFSQPMPRFDLLERKPIPSVIDANNPHPLGQHVPTAAANTSPIAMDAALGGGQGPMEGRPPGSDWAHQRFDEFAPKIALEATQKGATTNTTYNPGVASSLNSGIDPTSGIPLKFHPSMPTQGPLAVWTFNGTVPPKLAMGRYGEPILFRHHNGLSADVTKNGGFGRHTISTHEHNGHHGAENDGFTGAFFFPGQFYDYHWPIILAGHDSINVNATDIKAGSPADGGGINKVPGDWRETMSTHWFHDHMFGFTSQNVYKGNAAMFNIYSALDRGDESVNDGVNLLLPSGSANKSTWGNLDYDINLVLADKAWDQDGQLYFDIFDFDGFLGDAMTVNFAYKPFFEVEARKYRFRILNGSVSRFFKLSLSDGSPMIQIGNDGNLLPNPVTLTQLDEQGIAERFDIVIDFSRYTPTPTNPNPKVWMVNLCEHEDGKGPKDDLSLAQALSGKSSDPCVGKFLEFRVKDRTAPDYSKVPAQLIPNPNLSAIPVLRERTFEFGRSGGGSDSAPWTIKTDNGQGLGADYKRISAAPKQGTFGQPCREIWHLKNGGGGWDHPIHIHFEEGQILNRNGSFNNVPLAERGRKDVYRLKPGGSVTITMQFREFAGMFMEHCHNTVHEDHAMLLRYDVDEQGLVPMRTPIPTPQGVTYVDPDDALPTAF